MKMQFDAVIIGGGASGLMCAVAAKLKNSKLNIAIIEKNDRVGKKLLSTGNGRCNLTNKNVATDKYKGTFDGLADVLKRYDTDKLLSYFKNLGLLTFCDSEGRYYPVSKQASSVLDVLRFNAERLGVTILCKQNIHSISRQNGFTVKTADGVITADKLVICCGSKASPKLGGSASASDYLKNLGHTALPFSPALCPINVDAGVIKSLKGLRAAATVTLSRNGKKIKAEKGEVQFAD
ncbi:MAG: aminoacetone oxidase family FAD-binding enzyme, partial [Ruminococcus sp.]|nr:aminoacetone oxidase family FAD-binding enzyme [Ruminococcus sp.]